jgi:hypothetical protein
METQAAETLMQGDAAKALAELRDLGSAVEMEALAKSAAPMPPLKVNAHLHLPPNFSAFKNVRQVIDLAAEQGVGVVGASNYYDYEVYGDFASMARAKGIFPLFGLEIICLVPELQKHEIKINDPGNPGKFYLCGKGITRFADMTRDAQRILGTIRRNDSTRIAQVIVQLANVFKARGSPTGLDENAVIEMVVRRHDCPWERVYLQERHVCQAFQERFFVMTPPEQRIEKLTKVLGAAPKAGPEDAVKIQNEIRAHLLKTGKPGYVPETFVGFDDAYRLIVELGGMPCYPTLADGANPICGFEAPIEALIDRIKERKIICAEFIPIRNTPAVLRDYVLKMRAAGLVVTAGTEHNTLDLLPIAPTCLGGQPIPEDVNATFWEGACVVAAHQFLSLRGQRGFDGTGGEERIAFMAKLGATVINQYRGKGR